MSTNINANQLNQFIFKTVGHDLTKTEAQKYGIEDSYAAAAEDLDETTIDFNDFTDDLLAEFTVLFVAEQDKKAEAKDKEEEKKEQTEIKGKNGAGV